VEDIRVFDFGFFFSIININQYYERQFCEKFDFGVEDKKIQSFIE